MPKVCVVSSRYMPRIEDQSLYQSEIPIACATLCLLIELAVLDLCRWRTGQLTRTVVTPGKRCRLASDDHSVADFRGAEIAGALFILGFFFSWFYFSMFFMGNCGEDQRPDESDNVGEQDSVVEWNYRKVNELCKRPQLPVGNEHRGDLIVNFLQGCLRVKSFKKSHSEHQLSIEKHCPK
mmetsp:Transcript_13306/g.53081  ORF Transcript_13306/g.53081 Transcript_13306/m.53081 type:complete len:180 (-) Transcript_13306:948-1487(-)